MSIGVFEGGWWNGACAASGVDYQPLSAPTDWPANPHEANVAARLQRGELLRAVLESESLPLLLDNGGSGLLFLRNEHKANDLKLLHEVCGATLCSHFIDPLVTCFQGLPWPAVYQCLASDSWIKAVWDRAQVRELQAFGIPHVVHLPMAAPDGDYNTDPLDPDRQRHVVAFVGAQNTTYFHCNAAIPTGSLLGGVLTHASGRPGSGPTFLDAYHDWYALGEPVEPDDTPPTRVEKTVKYFNAKLFFNAAQCIRNRDRYVVFLQRHLGKSFELVGRGWNEAYGLAALPPYPGGAQYLQSFRDVAINLNLVNGNAETGLNMRHFEITAAGGFMLCAHQPELTEHFEIGKECVAFADEEDLLDKIAYYLVHPEERAEIARNGQRRTLAQHLYSRRLQTILRAARYEPAAAEPAGAGAR